MLSFDMPVSLSKDLVEDLEDLYENAPCGYLSLAADGRIVKSNTTLSTWLGVPADQLLGKRLRDLLNMAGRIFYETHFAPLLRMQGFFNEVALDLVTATGNMLPVLANALEKRDADGGVVFTRVTLFQASERRKYERSLVNEQANAVQERQHAKSVLDSEREVSQLREQFIAVLGHDLRNPVASINSAARLLLKEPQSERSVHMIELMQGSVTRMSGMIENLMDFARGRFGGGITLQRDATEPLEPVLMQVIDELRTAFPNRQIQTDFQIKHPVDADRGRVGQLLSNLLGNAITHGKPEKHIGVRVITSDECLILSVENDGEPISQEAMARLFQPFFRGEVRASQQGLGLGLHIASEIARAHDGDLKVISQGEVITFTFTMPIVATARELVP